MLCTALNWSRFTAISFVLIASGVGFGTGNVTQALTIAGGIALQNIPEGSAISLPLYSSGVNKLKAFLIGQGSGFVEVIGGVLGAIFVLFFSNSLPYILSFAAGTMIYVVCSELIPSTFKNNKNIVGILGIILGFTIMMSLDLLL